MQDDIFFNKEINGTMLHTDVFKDEIIQVGADYERFNR